MLQEQHQHDIPVLSNSWDTCGYSSVAQESVENHTLLQPNSFIRETLSDSMQMEHC